MTRSSNQVQWTDCVFLPTLLWKAHTIFHSPAKVSSHKSWANTQPLGGVLAIPAPPGIGFLLVCVPLPSPKTHPNDLCQCHDNLRQ